MKSMKKNEWIAVSVGIIVVAFFLFGGSAMDMFRSAQVQVASNQQQVDTSVGLQIQDVIIGTGVEATNGALLTVHYTGALTDGKVFDSSVQRNQPFQFILGSGQVIEGWDKGIIGMKVGGKRMIVIPSSLGYGANQVGPIPPNSTLIFEVELLKVEKPQ